MIVRSKVSAVLAITSERAKDVFTEICREGAHKMLQIAIEQEVTDYITSHVGTVDLDGRHLVVRNGHLPERSIQTGIGAIEVKQPRINDKRTDIDSEKVSFQSSILPPYLRWTKSIEELIPWLYLKGISTGDISDALTAIVGEDAPGLSATTMTRLKAGWLDEYKEWSKRYVYLWVDGIYSRVRLGDDEKQCMLVVMGATTGGTKELLAVEAGIRESELAWKEVLLDLKRRSLEIAPELAIGDGALGFWAAVDKVFPKTRRQRSWVHKSVNVLDQLPKSLHPKAKGLLQEIWMAETRKDTDKAFDHFLETFCAKYPKATDSLRKNRADLLAFYDFPGEHWKHLRTTNPIESTFATIRLRLSAPRAMDQPTPRLPCCSSSQNVQRSVGESWMGQICLRTSLISASSLSMG